MHFDPTINLGNLLSAGTFLILAVIAWTDLRWRVKNLETWRTEHMIDSDSRDAILKRLDRLVFWLSGGSEGRGGVFIRRDETRNDYDGPERRKKKD